VLHNITKYMKLISMKYSEFKGFPLEWEVDDFNILDINLIVGKNSDGKTRTLNLISGLGNIIASPLVQIFDAEYEAKFLHNKEIVIYHLKVSDSLVVLETLIINNEFLIERDFNSATIFNTNLKQSLKSQVPNNQLMVTRRDSIQYPYLEILYDWAVSLKYFRFGTELGKDIFRSSQDKFIDASYLNLKETNGIVQAFSKGNKDYPNKFKTSIINDLAKIGYEIKDIFIGEQLGFSININSLSIQGINVHEKDRSVPTSQLAMSTGMFRALAIIVYFNYYKFARIGGTVLIDDIGEGLDYERSTKLIALIIEKAKQNSIQLLLSTNDRFIMNQVPLNYWQVLNRVGGKVTMYNHQNSPSVFNDFSYTGLNNFDFFSTGFFKEGFKSEN